MFFKGRLFFLLEWLGYKASAVLGKEDDGYASKRTWGLLQKSVTVSQNQLMRWTSWVSCVRGRCLAKSPFEKNCLLLQKQKVTVLELIGQRVAAWHSSSCAPLCLGTLALSLPTPALAAELGVFFGENLSRIWPAESYHLHLPLCPCCESPVNDHTTGRASPSHTSAGFGTAMLCKDASKEAQTGGWCRLGHRTVGQALRKKLSPHIRKGGTALSNLKKCKDKQILKSQRNSSLLNFIFNTYSTCKVSVIVGVCAWEICGATKERNTLFQSGVLLHGTLDPFSCFQKRCPGRVGHLLQWKRYSLHHFTSNRFCLSWMRGGKSDKFTNTTQKKEAALKKI